MTTKDVETILHEIDAGNISLPVFQRGFVWRRPQVLRLLDSLYRGYPVGSLLTWETATNPPSRTEEARPTTGSVQFLLDGQQRITSLYAVIRGHPPSFFDGDAAAFDGTYFSLDDEAFARRTLSREKDPLWVSVTDVMTQGLAPFIRQLNGLPDFQIYYERLAKLYNIRQKQFFIDTVSKSHQTIDVVADIFSRVNSQGTRLNKADLALATISARLPQCRQQISQMLHKWEGLGYRFSFDFVLRAVNGILNEDAAWNKLSELPTESIETGLQFAELYISRTLNILSTRLGLDHARAISRGYSIHVLVRWMHSCNEDIDSTESINMLLYWYMLSGIFGRYLTSGESRLKQDYAMLKRKKEPIDGLVNLLKSASPTRSLEITPVQFDDWGVSARTYSLLYSMTMLCGGRDFDSGRLLNDVVATSSDSIVRRLIFPKSVLKDQGLKHTEIDVVANWCFVPASCHDNVGSIEPAKWLGSVEPDICDSQWIPTEPSDWKAKNYRRFLNKRRIALAAASNTFLDELKHGRLQKRAFLARQAGPSNDAELQRLIDLDDWVQMKGLAGGLLEWDLFDPISSERLANIDLAWPDGLRSGLDQPVAVIIGGDEETCSIANECGYRFFTDVNMFKRYVLRHILAETDS